MFVKVSVLAAIAALVNAAPSPSPLKHVLHEERSSPARDWVKGARIESSAIIPMRIGLAQTNLDKGYDLLMDVYVLSEDCLNLKERVHGNS
jgi:tripeptidyl-peptidase-1